MYNGPFFNNLEKMRERILYKIKKQSNSPIAFIIFLIKLPHGNANLYALHPHN